LDPSVQGRIVIETNTRTGFFEAGAGRPTLRPVVVPSIRIQKIRIFPGISRQMQGGPVFPSGAARNRVPCPNVNTETKSRKKPAMGVPPGLPRFSLTAEIPDGYPPFMVGQNRKSKEVVHIRQILGGVLKACRSDMDVEMIEVWRIWASAVGELIAGNTRPAAFKGKLLLVYASNSAWMHQLQFLKAELIGKVNAELGRELVSDIKFKIGPVNSPTRE
jgi:hypothetical protein